MKYLTYLAGPYSHPEPKMRRLRFEQLTQATAYLMNHFGWNVFSPITHSHPLHEHAHMRGDWAFWKRIDTQYIKLSKRVVVCTLDGWDRSIGVTAERKIARRLGLPVLFLKLTKSGKFKLSKRP